MLKRRFVLKLASIVLVSTLTTGCDSARKLSHHWTAFLHKVHKLAQADLENTQLRNKVHVLETENERLTRQLLGKLELKKAAHVRATAKAEGGHSSARIQHSLVPELHNVGHDVAHNKESHDSHGRTPASVHHEAPAHVEPAHGLSSHVEPAHSAPEVEPGILSAPPKKVYQEALNAFSKKEYDRAARGFIALAKNPDNTLYATAEVNLLAAVSLFELRNYGAALAHIDEALTIAKKPSSSERSFEPKILYWKALALQKLGRKAESKHVAQILVEHYPGTPESKKVK